MKTPEAITVMAEQPEDITLGSAEYEALTADIDKLTKRAMGNFENKNLEEALDDFRNAFKKAQQLNKVFTIRACAFNLGAIYIALRQPQKGIEVLQRAIPPNEQKDGKSNGDLYYNFGLAHEMTNKLLDAANYLELAVEEYQLENDIVRQAEVAVKVGDLYTDLESWLPSARAYRVAAQAYHKLKDYEHEVLSHCQQAMSLYEGQRVDEAVQIADDAVIVCQHVRDEKVLGKVYNELGLTYTQCHEFPKAATCFELALPLTRGSKGDRKEEAIIFQNLGAVYNSLGDYQRALSFHETAAAIHAELGSRSSQGQCFSNLAFAYSQLNDHDSAGECYLHALQASRDMGDTHAQWQNLEGLGAVTFNQRKFTKSISYFRDALKILSKTESNPTVMERITEKLNNVLQYQSSHPEEEKMKVKILVNDYPKPSTADEEKLREALRPLSAQPQGAGNHSKIDSTDRMVTSDQESDFIQRKRPGMRQNSAPETGIDKRRRPKRPLLRAESHDSTAEWRRAMKEIGISSEESYSDSDSVFSVSNDDSEYEHMADGKKKKRKDRKGVDGLKAVKRALMNILSDDDEPKYNRMKQAYGSGKGQGSENKRSRNHPVSSGGSRPLTSREQHARTRARMQDEVDANSTSETETETETESETESEGSAVDTKPILKERTEHMHGKHTTLLPPAPSIPLGTYEIPTKEVPEVYIGGNYFRGESSSKSIAKDGKDQYVPGCGAINVTDSKNTNNTTSQRDSEDPIYQTIRSQATGTLRPSSAKQSESSSEESSSEEDLPPQLPPRPTAEYQSNAHSSKQYDTTRRMSKRIEEEVPLPVRTEKNSSKTCIVM